MVPRRRIVDVALSVGQCRVTAALARQIAHAGAVDTTAAAAALDAAAAAVVGVVGLVDLAAVAIGAIAIDKPRCASRNGANTIAASIAGIADRRTSATASVAVVDVGLGVDFAAVGPVAVAIAITPCTSTRIAAGRIGANRVTAA